MSLLKIDKPIRLIELFAGIGSQAKALKILGANFEHYRICEFDKYAVKSYNAIHGTDFATSDITQITADDLGIVDTDKYTYICCYSFPCQDLSLAGKQKLMAKGSGTRSSLLWEVERLLNECTELPQILLMENVTQVHGKKNKEHFDEWITFLESKGYKNYWKDLNAKNFGIPQNRNRCFMVSVLGDFTYEFPKEFPLKLRLKDMLESQVDEKFYLSDTIINFFIENTKKQQEKGNGFRFQPTDGSGIGKAVTTRAGGRMDDNFIEEQPVLIGGMQKNQAVKTDGVSTTLTSSMGMGGGYVPMVINPIRLGGIYDTEKGKHQAGSVWDKETIAPTVDTMQGGNRQPLIISDPFIVSSRGRNPENPSDRTPGIHLEQRLEPNFSGCSNTLTTVQKDNYVCEPQVLRAERTEYGKLIRKQYEAGEIQEKIGNMREMKPRTDGIANTITTLQKDNYVCEPNTCLLQPKDRDYKKKNNPREVHIESKNDGVSHTLRTNGETMVVEPVARKIGNIYPSGGQNGNVYDSESISPTLLSGETSTKGNGGIGSNNAPRIIEPQPLRIRKLTPKECWRLMGFDDEDFEKAAKENSNTQLYKQAGNSIVVDVLCYIFGKML